MMTAFTRESHRIAMCRDCRGKIHWQDCPTGGWWVHEKHPEDHHDARGPLVRQTMEDWGAWGTV